MIPLYVGPQGVLRTGATAKTHLINYAMRPSSIGLSQRDYAVNQAKRSG